MLSLNGIWFAFLVLLPVVNGLVIVDSVVASSCIYYIKTFDWGCNSTGNSASAYTCRCGNIDWLGSITYCIYKESSNANERDHGLAHVAKRCEAKSKGLYDYSVEELQNIYKNASDYVLYPDNTNDIAELVTHPIDVNATDFKYYHDTFQAVMDHVTKTQWFGWGLNFYWVVIIVIATIYNISQSKIFFSSNGYLNKIKSNFIQSSLFKKNYHTPYYIAYLIPISIPLKSEFFTICIFWILVIIFSIVSYDMMLPNAYMGNSKFYNLLDYISYRTCIMSFSLLPSMYLMGIRNTPLNYCVNWSRKTLLSYHKTIALAMSVLAFVHSCVWTAYTIKEGDYYMWAVDAYWQWGIVAMIFLGLIIFFSLQPFRMVLYDTFLILHHIMSILFIVSIYYHANTLGWLGWCYSIIVIYCWDKLIRIIKIVRSGKLIKAASVEYFDDTIIKLSIPRMKGSINPGSYTYLYFLSPNILLNGWQSHPFSLYQDPVNPAKFTALIKVKSGITKKLYNKIRRSSHSQEDFNIPVITEGMYGNAVNIYFNYNEYSSYIFTASGTGITSIFPFIQEIFINNNDKNCNNSKIRLFWVVNNLNEIDWFEKELKFLIDNYCQDNSSRFRIEIIVTGKESKNKNHLTERDPLNSNFDSLNNTSSELDEKTIEIQNEKIMGYKNSSYFKISKLPNGTRPCLKKMVEVNQINCTTQFISCGPPSFCDGIRRYVNQYRSHSGNDFRVDYHELSYTW